MKKLILAIMMMAPAVAVADDFEVCKNLHALAKVTMEIRQDELPMPELIEIAHDVVGEAKEDGDYIIEIVRRAYKRPAFSTQEYKDKEVAAFSNQIYLECLEWSVK